MPLVKQLLHIAFRVGVLKQKHMPSCILCITNPATIPSGCATTNNQGNSDRLVGTVSSPARQLDPGQPLVTFGRVALLRTYRCRLASGKE